MGDVDSRSERDKRSAMWPRPPHNTISASSASTIDSTNRHPTLFYFLYSLLYKSSPIEVELLILILLGILTHIFARYCTHWWMHALERYDL